MKSLIPHHVGRRSRPPQHLGSGNARVHLARHLFRETQAASTPEYAILLVLILTVVVSLGSVAGNMFQGTFDLAALGTTNAARSQNDATAPSTEAENNLADSQQPAPWILLFAGSQAVLAITFIALFLRRARRRSDRQALLSEQILDQHQKAILTVLRGKMGSGLSWEPQVLHFMSEHVSVVSPKARFEEVQAKLEDGLHDAVFVVDENADVVGRISTVDLEPGANARKMMRPVQVKPTKTTAMATAMREMILQNCDVAPVMHDGKLCGAVSHMEIMLGLSASLQVLQESEAKFREKLMNMLGPTQTTFGSTPS